MKKKIIYIFGNPLLPLDNLPLKLAPQIKELFPEVDFIIADPSENLKPINGELIIIDTIEGIKKVTLIDDLEKIRTKKIYSLHDFDLGFNLKLLQKIGKLKKVKIFGMPMKIDEQEALKQLSDLISKNILNKSGK